MVDDIPFPDGAYRPPQVPYKDWSFGNLDRPINYPVFEEREHFLATIHGFDAGGFEATIRCVNLQALADAKLTSDTAKRLPAKYAVNPLSSCVLISMRCFAMLRLRGDSIK